MPVSIQGQEMDNQEVFHVAYQQARRIGMKLEDAQDCAMDFVVRLLKPENPTAPSVAWLHRCAYNHACSFRRTIVRRQKHESSSSEPYHEEVAQAFGGYRPGPKTLMMRKELWKQITKALEQLTANQRELFVRYHLRSETIRELALRFNRSPHAVEESLSNTRKRLVALLIQQGWTIADAKGLFQATSVTQMPPMRRQA